VLAMVGYVSWKDYDVAKREMIVFTRLRPRQQNEDNSIAPCATRLHAYRAHGQITMAHAFSTELEGKLAAARSLAPPLHA